MFWVTQRGLPTGVQGHPFVFFVKTDRRRVFSGTPAGCFRDTRPCRGASETCCDHLLNVAFLLPSCAKKPSLLWDALLSSQLFCEIYVFKSLSLHLSGWFCFGSVRLRFVHRTVRTAPVYGPDGSCGERLLCAETLLNRRFRFLKTVLKVPVSVLLAVPAKAVVTVLASRSGPVRAPF